jgi:cytochrome c biogenesis factor
LTQLGELSLWLALLMAAWCTTLSAEGAILRRGPLAESGARGLYASLFFAALAVAGLASAFVGDDFSVRYVAMHSGSNVSLAYAVCAIWSGPEGTLLFSSLLLAGFACAGVALVRRRKRERARVAWVVAALGLIVLALLATTAFGANPFERVVRAPSDGRGLDPQLLSPAMALVPPLLLAGLASICLPVALAIAAFIRPRVGKPFDDGRLPPLQAAILLSWFLLTTGIVLGAHWAYVSPGWTGFWAHNPVTAASVVCWLACSALLGAIELGRGRGAVSEADIIRRRVGRAIIAGAALLLIAAFAGRSFTRNYDVQLGDGQRYDAKDAWGHQWTFISQGASRLERPGNDVTSVALLPTRDGVRQPFVASESREYYAASGLNVYPPRTVPGIRSTLGEDLYVVVSDAGEGRAVLRISFKPLVELAWIGGVLLALGGLLLFIPSRPELPA